MATLNEILKGMLKEDKEDVKEEFVPFKKKDDDSDDDDKKDKKDDDDKKDDKEDVKEEFVPFEKKDDDDDKDEKDDDKEKEDVKESMEIHVEAIKTLFKDQDLSEETLTKLGVIFEAAVASLSKEKIAKLEESIEEKYKVELAEAIDEMDVSIDKYVSYAATEYMKENELAIETGIKSELVESFLSGLNTLYTEHYVELPADKVDVIAEMVEKVKESEAKLNVIIEANIGYKETINDYKKSEIIAQMTEGMADTDKEKFGAIIEEVKFEDAESYTKGIKTIKENYMFSDKKKSLNEEVVIDTKKGSMDSYLKAISGNTKF